MIPFLFIILFIHCFHIFLYDATLIIRYDEASYDLRDRLRSGYEDPDILDKFDLRQKEMVCNEVFAARQYTMDLLQVSTNQPDSFSSEQSVSPSSSEKIVLTETKNVILPRRAQKKQNVVEGAGASAATPRRKRSLGHRIRKKTFEIPPENQSSVSLTSAGATSNASTKKRRKLQRQTSSFQDAGPTVSPIKDKGISQLTWSPTESTLRRPKKSLLQTWSSEELPKQPTTFKSRYKKRQIILPGYKKVEAYSLNCSRTEDEQQLFVMYGLRRTDLFLLQGDPRCLAVTALIVQTPYIDRHQYKSRALLTYFLRQLEIGDDDVLQVPRNMQLCFLSRISHLRLCAATFEALVADGLYRSDALDINSVRVDSLERCLKKTVRLSKDLYVENVQVVPCSVNKAEGYADSQYYVLLHSQGIASAFIVAKEGDSEELTPIQIVEHVDVLFDIDLI